VNVFVTGGAGYIGSVCVEELLNLGHTVTVFDNCSEGHRQAIDSRAQFIAGDLCDPGSVFSAVGATAPQAIMHFAANALVGESMENPYKYFHNNVYGGLNLLRAAVEAGVKSFVFSSTCATYGVPDRVPIDEETPQNPINPYGESKLMFEQVLRWFNRIHEIKYVALRYFNAAGASERFGEHHRIETHLIPRILAVALGHSPNAEIYGTDYPNAGWHLHPRLHSHIRSRPSPHPCSLRRREWLLQFRNWWRCIGLRSHRSLPPSNRAQNSDCRKATAARGSSAAGCGIGKSKKAVGMDTEISGYP